METTQTLRCSIAHTYNADFGFVCSRSSLPPRINKGLDEWCKAQIVRFRMKHFLHILSNCIRKRELTILIAMTYTAYLACS